jgi:hypothetical protein
MDKDSSIFDSDPRLTMKSALKHEKGSRQWMLVTLAIASGIIVSTFRHWMGYPLTGDANYYLSTLEQTNMLGIQSILSTDRPILFLILESVRNSFSIDTMQLLAYLQPFLTSTLVVSTYLFTRQCLKDETVAILSAFLASTSPHVTIGVSYFIVANWFALALMMLFYVCILRSLESKSRRWAISSVTLSWLILGIHFPSWCFCILTLLGYAVINHLTRNRSPYESSSSLVKIIAGCLSVALPTVIIGLIMSETCLSIQSALSRALAVLAKVTPLNIVHFLKDDALLSSYFAFGGYATPIMYALALIGFCGLYRMRDSRARLILIWASVASIMLLVIPKFEQWRLLYMMPLETLAAFGLLYSLKSLAFPEEVDGHRRQQFVLGVALAVNLLVGIVPFFAPVPLLFVALVSSAVTCVLLLGMNTSQVYWYTTIGACCFYLLLNVPTAICRLR